MLKTVRGHVQQGEDKNQSCILYGKNNRRFANVRTAFFVCVTCKFKNGAVYTYYVVYSYYSNLGIRKLYRLV
jgi:hypothetical protein